MLQIRNGSLSLQVLAEAGGGIAGFDWHGRGAPIALMRRCEPAPGTPERRIDPRRLSCFPLLPWSNRITDGGFTVDGRRVELPPNCEGEPWPIHGDGWQRAWQVESHGTHELLLSLRSTSAAAYCYDATLRYALLDDALQVELAVTNTGPAAMPFGLGLHPYFDRHGGARLRAPAPRVWLNDGRTPLPTACVDVPAAWDFRTGRTLPEHGLDHAFEAWTGEAAIHWPALRLGLRIDAEASAFVLYTPAGEDYFCFEPVDHPIDAVHLPGGAMAHGMTLLSPRATLRRRYAFGVLDMAGN
jgi:aldose 1-epimerase